MAWSGQYSRLLPPCGSEVPLSLVFDRFQTNDGRELNIDPSLGMSSEEERNSEFRTKLASVLLGTNLMSHFVGTVDSLERNTSDVTRTTPQP
jgi:hypothetical protein